MWLTDSFQLSCQELAEWSASVRMYVRWVMPCLLTLEGVEWGLLTCRFIQIRKTRRQPECYWGFHDTTCNGQTRSTQSWDHSSLGILFSRGSSISPPFTNRVSNSLKFDRISIPQYDSTNSRILCGLKCIWVTRCRECFIHWLSPRNFEK